MPFNGSGTYSPPSPPNFPAISGAVITASYYNTVTNDIASGITACLTRDGQGGPTAAINWGGQNLTNVATFGAVTGNFSGAISGTTITGTSGVFSGLVSITSGGLRLSNNLPIELKNSGGTDLSMLVLNASNNFQYGPSGAFVGLHQWYSGGALRMTLDASGNLGIGGTPTRKLSVIGSASDTYLNINTGNDTSLAGLLLGGSSAPSNGQLLYDISNNAMLFITAGSERVRITTGGSFGLGTNNPLYRFHSNLGGDGVAALFSGLTRGVRVNHTTTETRVEGVNQDGSTFQPLWLGGSQVSMSESGTETARLSGGNLRVSGNVFVGSVSAGNQLATLASPTFTGVPAAPTAAGSSNDTTIATTAFVRGNFSLLASPTFTGTPAAPTAANGTNTTQLATTAFVQSQLAANAYATLASPALTGTPTTGGIEIGFRAIPRSTTVTTIAIGDRGRCIALTASITAPSGTFAAGDAISLYNDSASAVTITQGSGLTLRLAGSTTTGSRTLAARGMATLWYNSASEAIISGAGVS